MSASNASSQASATDPLSDVDHGEEHGLTVEFLESMPESSDKTYSESTYASSASTLCNANDGHDAEHAVGDDHLGELEQDEPQGSDHSNNNEGSEVPDESEESDESDESDLFDESNEGVEEDEFDEFMQFMRHMSPPSPDRTQEREARENRHRAKLNGAIKSYHSETVSTWKFTILRDLMLLIKGMKCKNASCSHLFFITDFHVTQLLQDWLSGKVISSRLKCDACGTSTCVACEPAPFVTMSSLTLDGKHLSWCCTGGRLFLLWILLCAFDQHFCKALSSSKSVHTSGTRTDRHDASTTSDLDVQSSGVGYESYEHFTDNVVDLGAFFLTSPLTPETLNNPALNSPGPSNSRQALPQSARYLRSVAVAKARADQAEKDYFNDVLLELITDLLPSTHRDSAFDKNPPPALLEILRASRLPEYCADLLRNGSLRDATERKQLYHTLLNFLKVAALHKSTKQVISEEYAQRSNEYELLTYTWYMMPLTTEWGPSLAKCFMNLNAQSAIVLKTMKEGEEDFKHGEGKDLRRLCDHIAEVAESVSRTVEKAHNRGAASGKLESQIMDVPNHLLLETHCYASEAKNLKNSPPGRVKRLITEISTLQTSLPPTIHVRYADTRPDIMKVIIMGPKDTPYENGMFEFDLYCNEAFPHTPPRMKFKGSGGGFVSVNPNLYASGKICLSLLGTWDGEPWRPKESTLLQIFVSIQAMIFCEYPWFNEPGREKKDEKKHEDETSNQYNQELRRHTVQFAMLDWLKKSSDLWQDVVRQHFTANAPQILSTVREWAMLERANLSTSRHQSRPLSYDVDLESKPPMPDIIEMLPELWQSLLRYDDSCLLTPLPAILSGSPAPPEPSASIAQNTESSFVQAPTNLSTPHLWELSNNENHQGVGHGYGGSSTTTSTSRRQVAPQNHSSNSESTAHANAYASSTYGRYGQLCWPDGPSAHIPSPTETVRHPRTPTPLPVSLPASAYLPPHDYAPSFEPGFTDMPSASRLSATRGRNNEHGASYPMDWTEDPNRTSSYYGSRYGSVNNGPTGGVNQRSVQGLDNAEIELPSASDSDSYYNATYFAESGSYGPSGFGSAAWSSSNTSGYVEPPDLEYGRDRHGTRGHGGSGSRFEIYEDEVDDGYSNGFGGPVMPANHSDRARERRQGRSE